MLTIPPQTRKVSLTSMSYPFLCRSLRLPFWPNTIADNFRFILNGLRNANDILGETAFIEGDWRVIGEYVYDEEGGRHQAFYAPIRDTMVMGELIRSHDRIQVEQSLKYSKEESERLWSKAGLEQVTEWRHGNEYGEWLP